MAHRVHLIVLGPSAIPFSDQYPMPHAMSVEEIKRVEDAFIEAVERCKQVGCRSPFPVY